MRRGSSIGGTRARRLAVVVVLAALVAGAGGTTLAILGGAASSYRIASVRTGHVEQTVDSVGTLQPANGADLSFQVSGQVAAVDVAVGDQVTAGEVVAALATSGLGATVQADQAAVTTAQDKLSTDEASQTTTGGSSGPGSLAQQIATAQQVVLGDQQQADQDQRQASADLGTANTACEPSSGTSSTGQPTGSAAPGASATPGSAAAPGGGSTPAGGSTSGTTPSGSTSNCGAALLTALGDETTTSKALSTLSKDETALSKLVGQSGSSTPGGGAGSAGNGGGPGGSSVASNSGSVASPEQIAADQATLDADDAQLAQAQQYLDEAQIESPIAGTVVAVNLAVGDDVTAASTSRDIIVEGAGGFEVTATIGVAALPSIQLGQAALVTPDGATEAIDGQVTQIAVLPSATGSGASSSTASTISSSATYPVTISLPASATGLFDGAAADVAIVVGEASHSLVVPTSAVHAVGTFRFVTTVKAGVVSQVRVTTGLVGDTFTQVLSGVHLGDQLVLANLSTPLPSANTSGFGAVILGGGGPRPSARAPTAGGP